MSENAPDPKLTKPTGGNPTPNGVDRDEGVPKDAASGPPTHRAPGQEAPKKEEQKEKIKGVFSTQTVMKVGTGTTTRKTVQKSFWMAEELEDGVVEIQPLNINYIPSGPKRRIAMEDLLQKFSPEPEFYVSTVFPAMKELNQTVRAGEEHREKGEYFSAENEFQHALKIDVDNVRANFGLGLTYLDRGESDKADNIFERLVKLDAAFETQHKHLFNDFGINLRKNRMSDQALAYYERAMTLAEADENLHYNMARALFEKQQYDRTAEHLRQALKMNPELEAALQFLTWMQEQGLVEQTPDEAQAAQQLAMRKAEAASDVKPGKEREPRVGATEGQAAPAAQQRAQEPAPGDHVVKAPQAIDPLADA